MISVAAGGVPEHFNLPWRLAIERGLFSDLGFEVSWTDFGGGSGQMVDAFTVRDLDIGSILCDGAVKALNTGAPIEVIGVQVPTPLRWGIHVAHDSGYTYLDQVNELSRFAISRFGSGSELMTYVLAERLGFTINERQFVIADNLVGARDALLANEADVFLWERFTTSTLVTNGIFRRLDDQPTPWPAFVIAARTNALTTSQQDALLSTVISMGRELNLRPDTAALVAERYNIDPDQAERWWAETEWSETGDLDPQTLDDTRQTLERIGAL